MYPNLVAATVLAAQDLASKTFMVTGQSINVLIADAMRQIAAGLPPPKP
jgi:hypothetical protein